LPHDAPTSEGTLAPIEIETRPGSIVDAQPPRAVAGGNVETSQRIVDLILGALAAACPTRVPAASCGTMSNLLFGDDRSAYYETIGGGAGAGPAHDGASAIQTHMTNTRNTPVESLEASAPVRVVRYAIRRGSGGGGTRIGGDGLIRELELTAPQTVTLVGERRRRPPYGLQGGGPGRVGEDTLTRAAQTYRLPAKVRFEALPGDVLRIETPGGGGFGDTTRARFWAAVLSGAPLTRDDLG
jgi:N-methylhydantoinase B